MMTRVRAFIAMLIVPATLFAQTNPMPLPANSPSLQQLQSSIVALQMYNATLATALKQIQAYVSSCAVIPPALLQQVSDVMATAKANADTATQVVAVVTGPIVNGTAASGIVTNGTAK